MANYQIEIPNRAGIRRMQMAEVASSALHSFGYNANTRELWVRFHSGLYVYADVPPDVVTGLCNAASKGQYMSQAISHVFQCEGFSNTDWQIVSKETVPVPLLVIPVMDGRRDCWL